MQFVLTVNCSLLDQKGVIVQDFRNLAVWQKAHQLTLAIYRATADFPKEELYGLTGQMRRSAASVPTNIAEGCGRDTQGDFLRFLNIAMGSASELHYQVILARDLEFMTATSADLLEKDVTEVKRMLAALIKTIRSSQ